MSNRTPFLHIDRRGEGPDVLFLHGLDSDSSVWAPTVDLLAGDHHCVSIDLPGHGQSPNPDDPSAYRREAVLDRIDELITDPTRPTTLVGHSLGGYLGMAHVLTRPGVLSGLVLVSTGPGFRDQGARESWNDRVEAGAPEYGVTSTAAGIALHVDSMVIDHLHEIDLPVALVVGSDDRAFLRANDYMERKLPNATRRTVEGARHYVMRSNPETVADAVRSITDQLQ